MIALRARREAYRIATDLMHPHLEVEGPPKPPVPVMDIPAGRPVNRLPTPHDLAMRKVALLVWLLVILVLMVEAAIYG